MTFYLKMYWWMLKPTNQPTMALCYTPVITTIATRGRLTIYTVTMGRNKLLYRCHNRLYTALSLCHLCFL